MTDKKFNQNLVKMYLMGAKVRDSAEEILAPLLFKGMTLKDVNKKAKEFREKRERNAKGIEKEILEVSKVQFKKIEELLEKRAEITKAKQAKKKAKK